MLKHVWDTGILLSGCAESDVEEPVGVLVCDIEHGRTGLDVLEDEPLRLTNPLSKIKDSGKLIITSHLAWGSVEARTRRVQAVYDNIKAFQEGKPVHVVNGL